MSETTVETYFMRCEPCNGRGYTTYVLCPHCEGNGQVLMTDERRALREAIDNWQRWLKGFRAAWNIR